MLFSNRVFRRKNRTEKGEKLILLLKQTRSNFFFFLMLVLLWRTSFLTTFYSLYFSSVTHIFQLSMHKQAPIKAITYTYNTHL